MDGRQRVACLVVLFLLAASATGALAAAGLYASDGTYLGNMSANKYDPNSISNPYGKYGSPYSATSMNNPYSSYGSPYSPTSPNNPYALNTPKIYAQDGTYLGKLSSNPYDPESISNPYGRYGSPYSSTSLNNPYSQYGSPYSSVSGRNPYATTPPIIVSDQGATSPWDRPSLPAPSVSPRRTAGQSSRFGREAQTDPIGEVASPAAGLLAAEREREQLNARRELESSDKQLADPAWWRRADAPAKAVALAQRNQWRATLGLPFEKKLPEASLTRTLLEDLGSYRSLVEAGKMTADDAVSALQAKYDPDWLSEKIAEILAAAK